MTAPPDPAVPAQQLVDGVGAQVLDLAAALVPVVVPFILALAAIRWVMGKFRLDGPAGLAGAGFAASTVDDHRDAYVWDEAERRGLGVSIGDDGRPYLVDDDGNRVASTSDARTRYKAQSSSYRAHRRSDSYDEDGYY